MEPKPRKSGAPKGGARKGGAPKGGAPKGGAQKGGAQKGGAQKGGAQKGGAQKGGAQKGGGPKISRFFFPFPPPFRCFCVSLEVFSWKGGGVFEAPGALKCARLEFSGCRVRAPAALSGGAAGVSHDSPRAQTCTFQGSGLQNTTTIQRKDTQRDTETAKRWREREEKEPNFGRSGGGVQWRGGPAESGPGKSKPATTITTTTTTTPNPEQVGPRPLSQARFRVFRVWAQQHTTTHNNTTNNTTTLDNFTNNTNNTNNWHNSRFGTKSVNNSNNT